MAQEALIGFYKSGGFELVGKSAVVHGADPWYEMRDDVAAPRAPTRPDERSAPPQGGDGGSTAGSDLKSRWPELVGTDGASAAEKIKADRPDLKKVHVLPEGSIVTMDHRLDRVRVYVSEAGVVTAHPRVG